MSLELRFNKYFFFKMLLLFYLPGNSSSFRSHHACVPFEKFISSLIGVSLHTDNLEG